MENVVIKAEPLSDIEGDISIGINTDIDISLENENTNQRNESIVEPKIDLRLTKQHMHQKNIITEKNNSKSKNVSPFIDDSEFPLLLNRSKTTTYSRKKCSKTEIRTENVNSIQATNTSTCELAPVTEKSPPANNVTNSKLPTTTTNTPETQSTYSRIRVSTKIFNTKPFELSVPSTAEVNKPGEESRISLDIDDDANTDAVDNGSKKGKRKTLPAKDKQNYELRELIHPVPPFCNISYTSVKRDEIDSTYLVRHVPPKRNRSGGGRPKDNLPKVVVCDICDLDFIGIYDLKAHLQVVHRPWALEFIKDVYCVHCRAWFDDEFQFKGHTPCYRSAVRVRCPICCMERPLLEHFTLHNIILRPGNNLWCKLCKPPTRHTTIEMNKHRQKVHQLNGVYECLECKETFARVRDMRVHVLQHVGNDSERNIEKAMMYKLKIKTDEDKYYKCEVCDRRFFRLRVCMIHQRTHDRPLCSVCGLSFRSNSLLVEHQNVHFKSESFDCKICGKKFTFRKYLTQHKRIHKVKKNFDCQFCDLSFSQQTSLIYHMATHTNENIFKCSICDIKFDKQSKLTSHMQIHNADGSNPHQCKLCNKYFAHNCNLLVHMRLHPEWKVEQDEKVPKIKSNKQEKENKKTKKKKTKTINKRKQRASKKKQKI